MTGPAGRLAGQRIAIANRGEIAIRIAHTCRRLGAVPILLLGAPDIGGFAHREVGAAELIGEAGAELDVDQVVAGALRVGADYLHPGYGFLSERADLANACAKAGIRFVGPSAATLRLCGDKLETRAAAVRAEVPVMPASSPLGDDPETWIAAGHEVGYPLIVKPAGAGGGRGLRHVAEEAELLDAVAASRREGGVTGEAASAYLERAMIEPRHVEVQVVAWDGTQVALGDRDCSLQRRHQKVIEEAPAPNIEPGVRQEMHQGALRLASEVGLQGVATCEFLVDGDGRIAFLEINPRIQVEHGVTEMVTGVDLVACQLRIASGESPALDPDTPLQGHAVEARVYAEDPATGFLPAPGRLAIVSWPSGDGLRVDAGYATNDVVPHTYDPLLAKVIAFGDDRELAVASLRGALLDTVVASVSTNVAWLVNLLDDPEFQAGRATTTTATRVIPASPGPEFAAAAALARILDAVPHEDASPWTTLGPWRLTGNAPIVLHGDDWEERFQVCRTPQGWQGRSAHSGQPVRWEKHANGVWRIERDGETRRLAVTDRDDGMEVFGQGGQWRVDRGPQPVASDIARLRAMPGKVVAPMPASVIEIHVSPGQRVTRGQPLVTLAAMKMEIICDAPHDAIVLSIGCAQGQLVTAGQELVTLRDVVARVDEG